MHKRRNSPDERGDRKLGLAENKEIWNKTCSSVQKMPEKIHPERKGGILPFLQNDSNKGKKQTCTVLNDVLCENYKIGLCGNCKAVVDNAENYCRKCGQAIDWR